MKKIIASWESRGGKYFVKLYRDDYGYGYEGNGCGGSFGNLPTDEAAIDYVENKVNPYCQASANKSPMIRRFSSLAANARNN